MPWKPSDAERHTKKANTPFKQRKWSEIANQLLKEGYSEGAAIRIANSIIKNGGRKKR